MTNDSFSVDLAVVGAGLIGGSIALRSHQLGRPTIVWDTHKSVRAACNDAGLRCSTSLAEAVGDTKRILIATPLDDVVSTLMQLTPHLRPGQVVTDVGSVKTGIASAGRGVCRSTGATFIPGHPLVGKAVAGFGNADPGLFEGSTWVLCADLDSSQTQVVSELAASLGAANLAARDEVSHDRQVAVVSHLPQLLVSTVCTYLANNSELGTSDMSRWQSFPLLNETLRLRRSPAGMWQQITRHNGAAIADVVMLGLEIVRKTMPSRPRVIATDPVVIVEAMSYVLTAIGAEAEARSPGTLQLAGTGYRSATSAWPDTLTDSHISAMPILASCLDQTGLMLNDPTLLRDTFERAARLG